MDILDEIMQETREDQQSIQSRCIPASQVQPGQWIHHKKTRATEGNYEVVEVTPVFGCWTMIHVNVVSRGGQKFVHALTYRPDETVEVIHK